VGSAAALAHPSGVSGGRDYETLLRYRLAV
jgi:hypothetical protein